MAILLADSLTIEDNNDGKRVTEMYRVSSAEVSGATAQEKMNSALSATNVPALGAASPVDATIKCTSRSVEQVGGTVFNVTCVFEVPQDDSDNPLLDTTGVVRFRAGLVTERIFRDKDGTQLQITYSGNLKDVHPGADGFSSIEHVDFIEIDRQLPIWSFDLTTRETDIATVAGRAQAYVGMVNDANWTGHSSGVSPAFNGTFPPRTVLCTSIELDVVNTGEYRATHAFEYKAATWDHEEIVRIDGRIPKNATATVFTIQGEAVFNNLAVKL